VPKAPRALDSRLERSTLARYQLDGSSKLIREWLRALGAEIKLVLDTGSDNSSGGERYLLFYGGFGPNILESSVTLGLIGLAVGLSPIS